jgi:acetolactate synthase-like protein
VPGPVFVELAVDLLYDEQIVRDWFRKKLDKADKSIAEHAQSLYIRGHLAYLYTGAGNPRIHSPYPVVPPGPSGDEVELAARRIAAARRPVMVIGSQAMLRPRRVDELVSAVERIGVPVYLSGMARGLLGRAHAQLMRHKRREALREADVVVLCGVPCDFRLDYGAHVARAHVIGVNLSKDELEKNRKPDLGILADPHTTLAALARELSTSAYPPPPARDAWLEILRRRDAEREQEIDTMSREGAGQASAQPGRLNPLALCRTIDAHLAEDSVIVGDGGDFVATASYTVGPRRPYSWLDPGVFGTLGVGAGFALGAKLVRPEADVWLFYGDGAAGFSIMEFDTFARHAVPVIGVVGNDAGWSQIARDQVDILGDDTGCPLTYMDYHKVVEGCGGAGILLDEPADTEDALARALALSRAGAPVLINALLARSDFRKGSLSM